MTEPDYDRAALEARNASMREQVDSLMDQFHRQTERLQEAQAEAAQATATVTSSDGLVTATVDSSGILTNLEFTSAAFQRSDPKKLAKTATETIRNAMLQVKQQVADLMSPMSEGLPDLSDLIEGAPSLKGLMPPIPDFAAQQSSSDGPGASADRPKQDSFDDEDEEPDSWLTEGYDR